MLPQSLQKDISAGPARPSNGPGVLRNPRARHRFVRIGLWITTPAAIAVLLSLPVRLPSVVNTFGTITSAHKWVLVRGADGQLIASTFNYQTGLSEGYRVSSFDPGSSVNFNLHTSLVPGQHVASGDTVGSIYSSEMQERLIALNGQLAAARSLLAVNASGQKAAIVNEAQQRLQFARRKKTEHEATFARSKKLLEADLMSQGEFELVQSEANALQDEIKIAEANLEAARTGAKPEQLELVHANIAALQNEIDAIQKRAGTYTLTAPISGTLSRAFYGDTLLTISDTTKYIALVPVKWSDYNRVASTQDPRVTLRGFSKTVRGTVIALNREVQLLHGQKVVIATALLEGTSEDLMPGMLARCRIACRPVTPFEYVKRFFVALAA